jgi:murein L,D-transpeptidase YafK
MLMMRGRKLTSFLIYLITAVFVILTGVSIVIYSTNQPPLEEMNLARESLALAKNKMASRYASETLKEAENLYNQSMSEWKIQNDKFFVFRDYTLMKDLAEKSYNLSADAGHEAKNIREKLKNNLETDLANLKQQIDRFEKYYKHLALGRSTLDLFNKGKTRFLEAQIEYSNHEFRQASKLAHKAAENLSQAEKSAHYKLINYYEDYPIWQKNIQLAYNLSKKGQTVILVDKMDASCIILKSGKEFKTFSAEFGISWMGDKNMIGDKATPEGVYKVVEKKSKAKTKYYKALLLNYPNQEDQKRYDEMVKSGKISKKTGIGGLIEIHGDGGKGVHWTDGCIALENSDMDVVFSQCVVGTPVIIVGSGQPLEEYLN